VEPIRNSNGTLVDLLDRILDKGLVIYADVVVSMAGIPLIGISRRAALPGMDTMVKCGIMVVWDEMLRDQYQTEEEKKDISEKIL
jgi:hypothetical protein